MKVFMVVYRNHGFAQKGVLANSEREAMQKFNRWRDEQINKAYFSEATRAYELELIV